jgi:uncharacterized protein YpiB (UPF0302 family)
MGKLLCKVCGNDKFQVLNVNEALCKCGLRLTNLNDHLSKERNIGKEHFYLDQKRQAEVITKVSLLKRAIDECLDVRDQEAFKKLTSELLVYQQVLQKGVYVHRVTSKERLKQNQDKM